MLSLTNEFKEKLRDLYRAAPLDIASFHRMYKACGPGECGAMCCNGGSGFYLAEEADTIRSLATENRAGFEAQGLALPERLFDEELNEKTGEIELSTNTRDIPYPPGLLPPHFPSTACIFRRDDGACSLQALGFAEDKPGWWYKPFACWLFPIELEQSGKPHIHVAHASTDEYVDDKYPGFVGFTPCGRECASGGRPAYEVLSGELKALSQLLDRDLLGEILSRKEAA